MTRIPDDHFAAALAHQLKSPASVLLGGAANLRRNLRGLLEDLAAMAGSPEAGEATASFLARAVAEPAPPPITGLLPSDRLEVIQRRLGEAGVAGDRARLAAGLLRGGWETYLDDVVPLLRDRPEEALAALETAARLRSNVSAIETSIARVSGLAAALRLVAGSGGSDPVDVRTGLRALASGLRETLPEGVALEVDVEDLPPLRGHAEALAEVWSNLITNAVRAVGRAGRVRVEGAATGTPPRAVVRVVDDGPGVPPEVLPRIFNPFFTTRPPGEGTGIGLALARRIVEGFGGEITCTSRPGRTVFEVSLPSAVAVEA